MQSSSAWRWVFKRAIAVTGCSEGVDEVNVLEGIGRGLNASDEGQVMKLRGSEIQ